MVAPAFSIRNAVATDAALLSDFAERMFRDTFAEVNTPADMAVYTAKAFSPELQRAQIASAQMRTLLVEQSHRLIGYAQLRAAPAPDCVAVNNVVELWRFYIDRAFLGLGIAQQLMRIVQVQARSMQANAIWLGVWEHNPRAIAFYRKFAFREVGSHRFKLGDDVQKDMIMLSEDIAQV